MEQIETISTDIKFDNVQPSMREIMEGFIRALSTNEEKRRPKLSKGDQANLRRTLLAFLMGINQENPTKLLIPLFDYFTRFGIPISAEKCLSNTDELSQSEKWALWGYSALKLQDKHNGSKEMLRFGETLAECDYSQIRLLKLLNSNNKAFIKEMISAVEVIKSKKCSLNLYGLGYFILLSEKKFEEKSLKIAEDYYKKLNSKKIEEN